MQYSKETAVRHSRRTFTAALASLGSWTLMPAWGQATSDYPSRPIRYVVPFPAGGLTDAMARLMAQKLTGPLKQPVVVENKPGANANLGADLVAKATPDGYTWLAVTLAHAVNQALFTTLPYSLEKNLTPVAHLATSPLVLVVNSASSAKSLKEFLQQSKGKSLSGGSSGNGTPPHLGLELLSASAQLTVTHVPYKGGAPSLNDLMGGQIDFIVSNLPECAPFVKSGRLRALAITSTQRHPLLPDVPTFAEQNVENMELENWTGLMMPAGTPRSIVERVASEAVRQVKTPEVAERVAAMGFSVTGLESVEFGEIIRKDIERWRELVKARRIKADA